MNDTDTDVKVDPLPGVPRSWCVSSEVLAVLQSCVTKQGQNATALGMCEWETQRERDKYLVTMVVGSLEFYAALGRLEFEYLAKRQFFLDTIKRTEAEQRGAGHQGISALGLLHQDAQGREIQYIIQHTNGSIMRFRSEGEGAPCWDKEF